MSNQPEPAVPITRICELHRRCHISGKGIRTFGTMFPQKLVKELATSSVTLVAPGNHFFASGTLVGRCVVLCAAHSLKNLSPKTIEIVMCFECNEKTAPKGMYKDYIAFKKTRKRGKVMWRTCTTVSHRHPAWIKKLVPIAKVVDVLEMGHTVDLDYALLKIEWDSAIISKGSTGEKFVKLERLPVLPKPGRTFSEELLWVGYPWGRG